jgi:adenylate kinase family enzyme
VKKVIVIGPGGAGKSTFATQLGALKGLPVIHLDTWHWKPGWVEPSKADWTNTVALLINREAWIMDGNYSGSLQTRLEASDVVIFLDLPRRVCLWRVMRRLIRYRNTNRPDMAPGCDEHFDLKFLGWIWNYRRSTRPKIVRLLETAGKNKEIVWLRSRAAVAGYLAHVANEVTDVGRS